MIDQNKAVHTRGMGGNRLIVCHTFGFSLPQSIPLEHFLQQLELRVSCMSVPALYSWKQKCLPIVLFFFAKWLVLSQIGLREIELRACVNSSFKVLPQILY
ncbi:hypothetical protein ILYODFUR_007961 [Ilyodon furcidens]|uniref:Uncharacterized protein n=1 Tax=Ilyodon furcidens TaxID=33524 RepID=A0ABV0TI32_9TELE